MKALHLLSHYAFALFALLLMSTAIATAMDWDLQTTAIGVGVGSFFVGGAGQNILYVGLSKEIWLPDLMEGFYQNTSFLSRTRDMSAFVDNDKINLAEAGVNPNVLINNTTYPIPVSQRADAHISLELDTYDTENTVIRNLEIAELSYDKRASILYGHKQALLHKFAQKAAHAYAPNANGEFTPILAASGDNNGTGVKRLTFEDVLALMVRYNDIDLPTEGRILVLSPQHEADLILQDKQLYKAVMDSKNLFGFEVFVYSKLAKFNRTTGVKVAFGAAPAATDTISSLAYQANEVMRAQGSLDMFAELKTATERGDVLGFQMRALALPIRNKSMGAIYSPAI